MLFPQDGFVLMFVGALVVPCLSALSLGGGTFPVTTMSLAEIEEGTKLAFWGYCLQKQTELLLKSCHLLAH